uniref:ATP-dependent DNA helicase n=1 Tax=Cyprinus carpio carpio TaxID=630221 RepID=A0A9J7WVU2_CYPCA
MLRQLGTPTFFCTFSAAEMRWPEVITAIKAQQGESVNFSELDWSEKCEILRSNPVTVMRMFEKRVEALMRDLIMSPAQPIGEVIDFFYRVEFQQRGSPHIHCLFWVKEAPEFEKDQDQDVCDFIDSYISCKLPDPNKDPELHRIVTEVQVHSRNHSKSCRKNKKHCRFGFPKPPINRTTITRPRPRPEDESQDQDESIEDRDHGTVEKAKAQLQKVWDLLNDCTQYFETIAQLCVSGEKPQPFMYFLNGGAGVGKSHVIKCIFAEATKILRRLPCTQDLTDISKPTVLLAAFTGTAAFNISGKTLHCLLKLPRNLKPPYQGLGNSLDEIRADLSNAHILIIDEISMVSKQLFAYVNWRLQQIKGNQKPFGGLSILAVGDFFQLPPLGRAKPLCVYEDHVLDFWKDNFQMITLTQIMRQRDDLAYAELLNRLRVKQKQDKLTDADKCMLETVTRSSPEECPTDALHIYATNKEVENHNTEAISLRFSNIINIDADDYKKDPRTGEMKRQAAPCKGEKCDLLDTLQIAIGARVMLTRNIDVEDGLVNGTFGNVVKITTRNRDTVSYVQLIGLHLDNVNAGQKYLRRQFPMKLAFACTVHKVQGMTTDSAVVCLKRIFEPGMAYVALSRTTTLSGLHVTDFDEKKIFCDPEISSKKKKSHKKNLG